MKRFLSGTLVLGLLAMPTMAGVTVTPMQGTMGNPFNTGLYSGFGWNAAAGGGAGPLIGNLYDNILTINGGGATAGICPPFVLCTQAFVDWAATAAQWSDDLHGLAGPAHGGPTAVITSIRYGYSNDVATTTHIIQIYAMIPPSNSHAQGNPITGQFGALLASVVIPGQPFGTVGQIVTITGLSISMGTAAWIKFGEQGAGFPGTFWLTGGIANGVGTSHDGILYSLKGPRPYQYFVSYFPHFPGTGYVSPNIQVALSGFIVPAPAVISLLGLGGLVTLRRCRSRALHR